jgi:hypothetical protein
MISPCVDVALVALFLEKLVSLHSDFPSSSYGFYRCFIIVKEKEKAYWAGRYYRWEYRPNYRTLAPGLLDRTGIRPVPAR